jgi:uncharacterized protein (TIGR02172 family)
MERKLIGFGRTADVFEYNNDCILKLYNKQIDNNTIKREFDFSKFAYENNIPTPEPIEIIQEQGRAGIIYRKINGESLLKMLMKNIFKIKKIFSEMAELQYKINDMEFNDDTHTFKKYLKWAVEENKYINEAEKNEIQKYIKELPDGKKLCHGDFHPENILYCDEKYYIIDWMTGMQGTIAADVARTEMIIKNAEIPGKVPFIIKIVFRIMQDKMSKIYVKEYCKISGIKIDEIKIWKLPLYVARLNENNSNEEEERILETIRKEMKKRQNCA